AWTGRREGSGLPWTKHPQHVFPSPTKPLPPGGPAASLQKGSELPIPKRVANLPVLEAAATRKIFWERRTWSCRYRPEYIACAKVKSPGNTAGRREGSGLSWIKHPRHVFPSPTKPLPPGGLATSLQKGNELSVPKRVANLP
ncbi:2945_t:CDS:2, partial [Ambispora leptoticha]